MRQLENTKILIPVGKVYLPILLSLEPLGRAWCLPSPQALVPLATPQVMSLSQLHSLLVLVHVSEAAVQEESTGITRSLNTQN